MVADREQQIRWAQSAIQLGARPHLPAWEFQLVKLSGEMVPLAAVLEAYYRLLTPQRAYRGDDSGEGGE